MNPLGVAAITAGVLVIWTAFLALRISLVRVRDKIGIGHEVPPDLHRAIRAHGNAAEHVPILLFGVFGLAVTGASTPWVAAAGVAAVLCRLMHGAGMILTGKPTRLRFYGTILTYSTMFVSGAATIVLAAMHCGL